MIVSNKKTITNFMLLLIFFSLPPFDTLYVCELLSLHNKAQFCFVAPVAGCLVAGVLLLFFFTMQKNGERIKNNDNNNNNVD